MLLLDKQGFVMSHDKVKELRKSPNGEMLYKRLLTENRAFEASKEIMDYLKQVGLMKFDSTPVISYIMSIIVDCFNATESQQDDFAMQFSNDETFEV